MDKHPSRLVDQLQAVHARQQKAIQQFQADNARLLSDLGEIRRERDSFRAEAARFRREHADLQNRLEELLSNHQDLKRDYATLIRSCHTTPVGGRPQRLLSTKTLNPLSVLTEGDMKGESCDTNIETSADKVTSPLFRELHDPLKGESEPPEPRHDNGLGRSRSAGNTSRITSIYSATY
ncbi:hypothetical protein J3A83DRAFT_2523935 [Scleroderma citrinum]